MPKGIQRGNREVKKPKKDKPKAAAPTMGGFSAGKPAGAGKDKK